MFANKYLEGVIDFNVKTDQVKCFFNSQKLKISKERNREGFCNKWNNFQKMNIYLIYINRNEEF